MQFAQIYAMIRYEFMMHWRRRVLVVATLSLAGVCTFALIIGSSTTAEFAEKLGANASYSGVNIVPFFGLVVYFVMIALFTPIAADAIPLDHHFGISELMNSLPIRRDTYLIGKLVGMFTSAVFGIAIAMVILGFAARLVLGTYDLGSYVQMWALAALPLALLNPSLCLLAAAGQPSRRRAALIGGLVAIACFMSFTTSVNRSLANGSLTILDLLNPARPAILRYLMPSTTPMGSDASGMIFLTIAVGLAELLLVGGVIWMWMGWREKRA
jgi:ABC-type transport system involved in multi-copper enzyme maturation permease subunit